jgi:putative DNA primase/helicase
MLQIGTIRKGFSFIDGFIYPSLGELFERVEKDLPKFLAENDRYNVYFTVAHHLKGKRIGDSFKQQDVIAYDIDGVDYSRIMEYLPAIEQALGVDIDKCGVVFSGNGLHIYIKVNPITDRGYFKKAKEGYGVEVEKINQAIIKAGLVGAADRTAWDSSRVLRLPFTKNVKFKDGVETIKDVILHNSNLELQDYNLPEIVSPSDTMTKGHFMTGGTFPSPDIKTITKECLFMRNCVESPKEVHEPDMYAFFSILGHSIEGRRYALDFASKNFSSPSIDACDKDQKMHQAVTVTGPRTCAGIADLKGVSICQDCKHYNKITSPIQIKGDDFIGTAHLGFTLKGVRGSNQRQYSDLLLYYDKMYQHKSVGAIKKIYIWTGTHYRITNELEIKNFAHERFMPLANSEESNEFYNLVKRSNYEDESFLSMDSSKGLINLANGVLDIKSGRLDSHDKKYNFLYCLPYDFNPDAKAPKFEKFLHEITLGRECLKNILLEYIGYVLSGSPYIYQKALIMDGGGKNGKTTLLKVIKKLVGHKNLSNISIDSLVNNIFSSSGLHGKLVNISEEEPPKSFSEKNGVFKNLTGDGTVNAQYKYGDAFEFDNRAKLIVTYNELPYLADTTAGMLRRLMIVPFDYDLETAHADKVNPLIDDDLEAELEGIFNLALEGYYRLSRQKGFTKSVYVDAKIEAIHTYSDIVYAFINDSCELTKSENDVLDQSKLYDAYEAYHKDTSGDRVLTKAGFTRRLKKYGVNILVNQRKVDGKKQELKKYTGVKLLSYEGARF